MHGLTISLNHSQPPILACTHTLTVIPGFEDKVFPRSSLGGLSLVANLGLVLYLYLLGIEVDFAGYVLLFVVCLVWRERKKKKGGGGGDG